MFGKGSLGRWPLVLSLALVVELVFGYFVFPPKLALSLSTSVTTDKAQQGVNPAYALGQTVTILGSVALAQGELKAIDNVILHIAGPKPWDIALPINAGTYNLTSQLPAGGQGSLNCTVAWNTVSYGYGYLGFGYGYGYQGGTAGGQIGYTCQYAPPVDPTAVGNYQATIEVRGPGLQPIFSAPSTYSLFQPQPQPQATATPAPTATPMPPPTIVPEAEVVAVAKAVGETVAIVQPDKEAKIELQDMTIITVPPAALAATVQMKARSVPEVELPKAPVVGKVRKALEIQVFDVKGVRLESVEIRLPIVIEVPLSAEDLATIGNDPNNVELYRYDDVNGVWVKLASVLDPANKVLRAQLRHLSLFAVVVPAPAAQVQPTPTAAPPSPGGEVPSGPAWLMAIMVGLGMLLFGFRLLTGSRQRT